MVPSGPPGGVGGAQSIPSLLRTNSGLLGGGQPGSIPSPQPFASMVSPRAQFNGVANGSNMPLLGGITNVSSLLNHSFGNGVPSSQQLSSQQRGGMCGNSLDMLGSADPDALSFPLSTGPLQGQYLQNTSGNQLGADHSQSQAQQLDAAQNFQQQQQQQLRGGIGNVSGMGQIKLEQQLGSGDPSVTGQQLQTMRGSVKMDSQQLQSARSLVPVKLEHQQHTDSSLFLQQQQQHQQHQQQQQQQQLMQMSRSNSHAATAAAQMSLLQQQRLLQLQQQQQHQQQQQLFKTLPQRAQLQQLQHGLPIRTQLKPTIYEPGMCARRLTQYMFHQQRRPEDNNIEFWGKFVQEFFAPNAKKRWCVSLYGSGRQTTGVFPQDVWHCELCNRKPGRGFEATFEVLPRLLQIKYASGTLEELLYVDMPRESQNTSGQIVLDYAKAVQESVFEQLRVVRDGQLRIVFNPDLKISSWEFCARRHEELIPRRLIIPQVSQLGTVVQKYQTASQNSSGLSLQDLQNTCNSFVASARQLAKALEVPLVNDLGYTKRYVRCLQISEVVNSMKDLIDYSKETGTGPMDSLINFPKRNSSSSALHSQQPQPQGTNVAQISSQNEQTSSLGTGIGSSTNGAANVNNPLNAPSLMSASGTPIVSLLHQNSMNSRHEALMNTSSSIYGGGNPTQIPSASSSSSIPPSQPNASSPFLPIPPSSENMVQTIHNSRINSNLPPNMASQPRELDLPDSQASVHQMLHDIMMSSQLNYHDMKSINSVAPSPNGESCLVGSGMVGNSGIGGTGFGGMAGIGPSVTASGLRAAMANNALAVNSRVGMNHGSQDSSVISHQQQQDMENRLLGGLRPINSFNNMQFDWKPSP